MVARQTLSAAPGNLLPMSGIIAWLELNGFNRTATVREAGEYAVRGGIVDLFAPGMDEPVRLDFFGDTLESIRSFDPDTQRTTTELRALDLVPVAEFQLTSDTIRQFRTGYVAAFGAAGPDDVLYHAVSEGRRYAGMEHWLPLFHKRMETLFDYLAATHRSCSNRSPRKPRTNGWRRSQTIMRRARQALEQSGGELPYKPLPPDRLYLAEAEWGARLDASALARLSPFDQPPPPNPPPHAGEGWEGDAVEIGAHAGHNFTAERSEPNTNVFEALDQARRRRCKQPASAR